jgi:NADH:ubiquinone oxidoreductase subunit E
MISTKENGKAAHAEMLAAVRAAVERHGAAREELIPILTDVNRNVGYLPAEALEEISRLMRVPKSQLFSVATFYRMLSTKKLGRHVIQFCESAPCHVVGGREVWQALQDAIDLEPGETSADGKWSLVTVSCLGVCGVGPVVLVDDDIYGNVTPAQVVDILAGYE